MGSLDGIQEQMKALRYHGRGDIRIESIPPQPCGPDEVRVKVAYCGICGTDLHEYTGGPIFVPKQGEKHRYNGSEMPITMGHEMSGIVVEIGAEVDPTSIRVGQRVMVSPCIRDRQLGIEPCVPCGDGRPNICSRLGFLGLSGPGGGLAEYLVTKAVSIFSLPDSVPLEAGALVEPLSVAWHCVRISGFQHGQDAVILGAGPIGLALLLALKVWGARTIMVSEVLENRAELAHKFGADYVINPLEKVTNGDIPDTSNPVAAKAREISGGALGGGAHVAFDATGVQATLDTSIACVRNGGTIVNVAIHEKPLSLNLNALVLTEKKVLGSLCFTDEDIQAVIHALAEGTLVPNAMITSIVPLEDAIEGAFKELVERRQNHVKILVQPNPYMV